MTRPAPEAINDKGAKVLSELGNFTGTDHWYRHGLRRSILMTDGVMWLAETAGAHWLTDIIVSHQTNRKVRAEEFQVWTLYVRKGEAALTYPAGRDKPSYVPRPYDAIVVCTNGNDDVPVVSQRIHYTDFPLSSITLYFENSVICLPSER